MSGPASAGTLRRDDPVVIPAPQLPPELAPYRALLDRLGEGHPVVPERSALVDLALEVSSRPGFDVFVSLPRLRFEPFAYQLRAAEAALRRMRGRAILADEVGLGKTIEAGLVLSELRLRGLAPRVLVLSPAGLVGQWQEELDRKFALPSIVAGRDFTPPPEDGLDAPVVIASVATARRSPLRGVLAGVRWDMVIADEAHRLKSPASASGKLARALRTRHLLLLTATPVENRLEDLFQLVSLVSPGLLGTPAEFRRRHGATGGGGLASDAPALRTRLQDVMVRHRRSEVALMLPRRLAETLRISPGPEEAELYRLVSDRVRSEGRRAHPSRSLALSAVQRLAGSSPAAVAPGLEKLGWEDLAERARVISVPQKGRALLSVLQRHLARGEKVLVFGSFRRTLDGLARLLAEAGIAALVYHGSLSRQEKDRTIEAFRTEAPVLLSTEAGGEGRNLQFCHAMVNFDLPWNPMQIEQRLGRIHRIGQDHDVLVTNLAARETVEERILRVLETKINLFELVVGELDMILGRVDDEFDFERAVWSAHVQSADDAEFASRLEELGDELAGARRGYLESRGRIDGLGSGTEP